MEVQEALKKFINKCAVNGLTERTIENYRTNLQTFSRWFEGQLEDFGEDEMDLYILYLRQLNIADTTLNNKLRDLRVFMKFCTKRGWVKPIDIRLPRIQDPEIIPLDDKQLHDLYDACFLKRTPERYRDYTIMRLMEETGIRLSECMRLTVHDLNMARGYIVLGKTKNKKNRLIYISPNMKKDFKVYLEVRAHFLKAHNLTSDALWIVTKTGSNMGQPLKARTFQDRMGKYGQQAGLDNIRVSPHTLRHTFARNYLLNGGDIFTLQELLGHNSLEMVRRYVMLFSRDRQQKYLNVMRKRKGYKF
jgi:integrase/recombinase XerD